jgi:hypothetical protein
MDDDDTLRGQFLNLLAIPAGLLLLVPLALLFLLWFYAAALAEGVRLVARVPFSKARAGLPNSGLQKPHFTEASSAVPTKE